MPRNVERRSRPSEVAFTLPMECLPATQLPEGPEWSYEVKLDGYRAQALHAPGRLSLLSRNGKDLNVRFADIVPALAVAVPSGAAVDGELVAMDEHGQPSFQLLQDAAGSRARLVFFAFDLLAFAGRDITSQPLMNRRLMLQQFLRTSDSVQVSESLDLTAMQMMGYVRKHGLEGVVAKQLAGRYEPGRRTGAWTKLRVRRAQEFVIGGFTRGNHGFDSLLIGFYRSGQLIYCARVRNGFVPVTRRVVHSHLFPLISAKCPFHNFLEPHGSPEGQTLDSDIRECVWVRPEAVGQFAFLEWTPSAHLRHARFLGLRDDKDPRTVVREV